MLPRQISDFLTLFLSFPAALCYLLLKERGMWCFWAETLQKRQERRDLCHSALLPSAGMVKACLLCNQNDNVVCLPETEIKARANEFRKN